MAGAKKAVSDYLKQTKSYDAGKPGTSVPDNKKKKKGFQPAENVGMPMPSPVKKSSPATESEKINMSPEGYVAPGTRDIFDAFGDMRDKQRAERRVRELPNKNPYDETSWRNLQMPHQRPATNSSTGLQSDVAGLSKAFDTASQKNINRFDPSKTTLGNNEFTGQVGLFKDGQMLESSQRLSGGNLGGTPLPAGQQTSFMRMPTPEGGRTSPINFTDLFARDAKIGAMQLANAKNDYRIGEGNPRFFTGPGEPGAGNYGQNSMMSQFKGRRDQVQARLDEFNRMNPLSKDAGVGEIIAHQAKTKAMRDEIKHIDEQIFGRTDLANKIMTALIGKDAALEGQMLKNKGSVDVQVLENEGTKDVRSMMEGHEDQRHAASLLFGGKSGSSEKDPYLNASLDLRGKAVQDRLKYLQENGDLSPDDFQKVLDDLVRGNFTRPAAKEKEEDDTVQGW